jgi:two-component system, LytTR family, sensor histidine kinase AlgZ
MKPFNASDFIFSSRYRIWRHLLFWAIYTLLTSLLYVNYSKGLWSLQRQLFLGALWLPVRILYCYPFMYWVLPKYLLKGKYVQFGIIVLLWFIAGWFLNYLFRAYLFIPIQEALHFNNIVKDPWMPGSFLLLTTVAGLTSIIVLFKYWYKKQQEWMQAEKEKVTAELQLLKAQVHPHFLFNTLNNIYSFSLENSPKTPGLILKLSSLLSYMLYDCKTENVLLEKEIEIMKNYIDLESERYGNKIEISWSIEGDIRDKYIAPLLMLPFLENAFKHGTSEQLEKPWLSVDISVKHDTLKCKIANSKNEYVPASIHGIGIENVKKRLGFMYPEKHELKMNDEGNFFVVSLLIELKERVVYQIAASALIPGISKKVSI